MSKPLVRDSSSDSSALSHHPHNSHPRISISLPSQSSHQDQEDNSTLVAVYLYVHNHKAIKISLASSISIQEISSIIHQNFGISQQKQQLHLNGKNVTKYAQIRLHPNNIIHISNTDQLCHDNQTIKLKVILLNFIDQKQEKICLNYTAAASDLISDFTRKLSTDLRQKMIYDCKAGHLELLQSSRLLSQEKTFVEQSVSLFADVVCIVTKNEIKTRFTNDTKEEILNDISELLGFDEVVQNKIENQQKDMLSCNKDETRSQTVKQERSSNSQEEPTQLFPNFKKKNQEQLNLQMKGLLTKIKSTKSKQQLDILLKSQKSQKLTFEQTRIIKQQPEKEEDFFCIESPVDLHKPSLSIPKTMPANERRKIKLEMQKLLEIKGEAKNKLQATGDGSQANEGKEQRKPISPATQTPRPTQKLRFSMGSRPVFLQKLRNPKQQS